MMGIFDRWNPNRKEEEERNTPSLGFATEKKPGTKNNEDACNVVVRKDGGHLAVLCDGMTGAEMANRSHEISTEAVSRLTEVGMLINEVVSPETVEDIIRNTVRILDMAAVRKNESEFGDGRVVMSSTLVMAVEIFNPGTAKRQMVVANCGDSRLYILRRGQLELVTLDQIRAFDGPNKNQFRQVQEKMGESDRPDLELGGREIYQRGVRVTNLIGMGHAGDELDVYVVDLDDVDAVLLCSDGISDPLKKSEISDEISSRMNKGASPSEIAKGLISKAARVGGSRKKTDDRAAVVFFPQTDSEARVGNPSRSDQAPLTADSEAKLPIDYSKIFTELRIFVQNLKKSMSISGDSIGEINRMEVAFDSQKTLSPDFSIISDSAIRDEAERLFSIKENSRPQEEVDVGPLGEATNLTELKFLVRKGIKEGESFKGDPINELHIAEQKGNCDNITDARIRSVAKRFFDLLY